FLTFKINKHSKLLLQNGSSATNRLFRINSTVGFQIQNQFVQVSTLLYTSTFNTVSKTLYRTERSIQLQTTNCTTFIVITTTAVSWLVPAATSKRQAPSQFSATSDRRNHLIWIFHVHIMVNLNISGCNNTRTFFGQC